MITQKSEPTHPENRKGSMSGKRRASDGGSAEIFVTTNGEPQQSKEDDNMDEGDANNELVNAESNNYA